MENSPRAMRSPSRAPQGAGETDAMLMDRLAQRDEQALATLYDRYARLVYAIAVRIAADQQIAEEVVQDVFHAIWQSAASFQRDASLPSWIMGIARHRAIDATRSRRYRARQRETALLDDSADGAVNASEATEDLLLRHVLVGALRMLPRAQSQPLALAYYGDLTHHEIATRLGAPVGTIKSRMRLGMLKLRNALDYLHE